MRTKLLLISSLLWAASAGAQYLQCNQEIGIGVGIFSSEQILDGTMIGLLEPTMRQYSNSSVTGTWFADYKFFVSKRVTVGVFAAMEKESGAWIYDNIMGKPDDWTSYAIGTFSRTAYTVALEMSFAYVDREDVRIYSTFGIGGVYKKESDVYDPTLNGGQYYRGSGSQTVDIMRGTAYYSPLGMSFGRNLRGFFELGIGYKGILNGGICYKLNTLPKRLKGVPKHADAPVIIMPHDLAVGNDGLKYLDHLKSCGFPSRHHAGFEEELAKVVSLSQKEGANGFYISDIEQRGEADRYSIRGTAFYAADYNGFKARVEAEKSKPFKDEQCAYVVVYCPPNRRGPHDKIRTSITVNDTGSVLMGWDSKHVMKLTKEDPVVIFNRKEQDHHPPEVWEVLLHQALCEAQKIVGPYS